MSGMRKKQIIGKERLLFTNKALAALILPLIVEQFLAVLVGMADSVMVASVGEAVQYVSSGFDPIADRDDHHGGGVVCLWHGAACS